MSMPPPPPGAPPPPPPGSGEPSSGGQPPYVGGPPGYPPASPPPPPTPPGYVPFGVQGGGMPQGQRTNGLAVASLVLGIVGILLCFLFIPWILAIIFGAIGIKQCNADPTYSGKGLAVAGLVCGLVGLGLMVLVFATGDTNFEFGLLSPTR